MIYVDDRIGSKELIPLFPKGTVESTHLEYADAMFTGHYDDGDIVIGVERKRIGDFVNSMCSGRLSGRQLIGLMNSYHYVYLIVEGIFRANPHTGVLEVHRRGGWEPHHAGKRTFMARDVWAFMNTLAVVCDVKCYHCPTDTDTVHYIMALHHWWMKEYADHRGHLQPHTGTVVELSKHTLVRRVAAQIDGVGWKRAKAIDQVFGTVAELVMASPGELAEVEGVGKTLSLSIVEQLRGKD